MSTPHILCLSGALRTDSTNSKLLNEAVRLFGDAQVTQADLNLPLYDGDAEAASGIPEMVQTLADQIAAADAVLIATPEYNKGLSGVLKNALDWVSRTEGAPWAGKPVAIMSAAAGRSGGELGQAMLRQCLVPFQPEIIPGPALHLAASYEAFDDNGHLLSAQYTATLQSLMDALRARL